MVGFDADYFRAEGDYAAFIRTHLMRPLTDVRGGEEARALGARERPRVTQARQRTNWPELPTTLTCWQHTGDAYQVPIKPMAAGHELIRVRGPIQV